MYNEGIDDIIPLANLDLGAGEGVSWQNVVRLVRVIQKNGLSEEARFCLKTRMKSNTTYLILNTLTVIHTIAINSSSEIRRELSQTKWFKYIDRQLTQSAHPACSQAAQQILVDWENLFGTEELGKRSSHLLNKIRGVRRPQVSDGATAKREEWDSGMPVLINVQHAPDFGLLENGYDQNNIIVGRSYNSTTSRGDSGSPRMSSISERAPASAPTTTPDMFSVEEMIRSVLWISDSLETKIQHLRNAALSGDRNLIERCMSDGNKLASDGQNFKLQVQDAVAGSIGEGTLARLLEANDGLSCVIDSWSEEVAKTLNDIALLQQQQQIQRQQQQEHSQPQHTRQQPDMIQLQESNPSNHTQQGVGVGVGVDQSPPPLLIQEDQGTSSQPQQDPFIPPQTKGVEVGVTQQAVVAHNDLIGLDDDNDYNRDGLQDGEKSPVIQTTEFNGLLDWLNDVKPLNNFLPNSPAPQFSQGPSIVGNPFETPSQNQQIQQQPQNSNQIFQQSNQIQMQQPVQFQQQVQQQQQIDSFEFLRQQKRIEELESRVKQLESQLKQTQQEKAEEVLRVKQIALKKVKELERENQSLKEKFMSFGDDQNVYYFKELQKFSFDDCNLKFNSDFGTCMRRSRSEELAAHLVRQPAFGVRFSQQYLQSVLQRVGDGSLLQK